MGCRCDRQVCVISAARRGPAYILHYVHVAAEAGGQKRRASKARRAAICVCTKVPRARCLECFRRARVLCSHTTTTPLPSHAYIHPWCARFGTVWVLRDGTARHERWGCGDANCAPRMRSRRSTSWSYRQQARRTPNPRGNKGTLLIRFTI